jgi:hypothetical protein
VCNTLKRANFKTESHWNRKGKKGKKGKSCNLSPWYHWYLHEFADFTWQHNCQKFREIFEPPQFVVASVFLLCFMGEFALVLSQVQLLN